MQALTAYAEACVDNLTKRVREKGKMSQMTEPKVDGNCVQYQLSVLNISLGRDLAIER